MARVQTKAEISPATAAAVFFLVLAVAGFSLWYFVIQNPLPDFSPPAIAPRSIEPRPTEKPAQAHRSNESHRSYPAAHP